MMQRKSNSCDEYIQAQGYKGFESNRNITEKSVEIATALETSIKGFAMTI